MIDEEKTAEVEETIDLPDLPEADAPPEDEEPKVEEPDRQVGRRDRPTTGAQRSR